MTGGVGLLGGVREWLQQSYIVVTPWPWFKLPLTAIDRSISKYGVDLSLLVVRIRI